MSLVSAALYLVGMFTSGILIGRLPIYCDVYDLILIPFLLQAAFDNQERKISKPIYTCVLLLYFYLLSSNCYYISDITGLLT